MGEGAGGGPGYPTFMRISLEEQLENATNHATQSCSRKESFKTSGCKNLWGQWWEKLPVSQESTLEKPQDPRMYTSPLTMESAPEGPNLLVGKVGEMTESRVGAE